MPRDINSLIYVKRRQLDLLTNKTESFFVAVF